MLILDRGVIWRITYLKSNFAHQEERAVDLEDFREPLLKGFVGAPELAGPVNYAREHHLGSAFKK